MRTFTQVRRGYETTEVDTYIRELEATLAAKNAELDAFHQKETAITKSVIDAQILAADIKAKAEEEVSTMRANALAELDDIKSQVSALHNKLSAFQSEYSQILQRYLVNLRCEDLNAIFGNLENFMSQLGMETAPAEEVPVELTDLHIGE